MTTHTQSLLEYIKSHYKLPLTMEDEQRCIQFFDDVYENDEGSSVHTTIVGSLEAYEAEFTLMRELTITRLSEYLYSEELVFSLKPITPGIVTKTTIRTNPLHPVKDSVEFPNVVLPEMMNYNIAVIRTVERYFEKPRTDFEGVNLEKGKYIPKISYDILIYNGELEMVADGIFFEDILEED